MIHLARILQHNVIGKLLNHLIVFAINICIVRWLGAQGSGAYFNELYLLNLVVFICSMGLDYACIALLAGQPWAARIFRVFLTRIALLFFVLLAFFLLAFPKFFLQLFNQPVIAVMLFSTGNLLLLFFQGFLSALKKFNLQNVVLGISNLFFLAWLFFVADRLTTPVAVIIRNYAMLFFVQGGLMLLFSYAVPLPDPESKPVNWNLFLHRGLFIMFSSLVYFIFLRADNFFVERYCNNTALGNYVQAGKIGQYFIYFSTVISATLLPFIKNETVGSSYEEWRRMMKPYLLLILAAALGIAFTGKWLFPFLFGEDFTMLYPIMLLLLPGYICLGLLTLINSVFIGKGSIRQILISDTIGLVLLLVLDILFVPRYGVIAAAIISSGCYIFVFAFLARNFKQQFLLHDKGNILS
ncbi:MAG: hypothetical protein JWQ27_328 [Ferruginibacter sp.]|nr:hypothetical protein [Ferruginibacter sp.]